MGVTCVTKKVEVEPAAHERKLAWQGSLLSLFPLVCGGVFVRISPLRFKMALTALLVVLRLEKSKKRNLCRNLFNRLLSFTPVLKSGDLTSYIDSHNPAITQQLLLQHDFTQWISLSKVSAIFNFEIT